MGREDIGEGGYRAGRAAPPSPHSQWRQLVTSSLPEIYDNGHALARANLDVVKSHATPEKVPGGADVSKYER